nr:unnamed protein product [Haemonchus contortus]
MRMRRPKRYRRIKFRKIEDIPDPAPDGKVDLLQKKYFLFWYSADIHTPIRDLMLLTQLYTRADYSVYTCNGKIIREGQTPAELSLVHGDIIALLRDPRLPRIPSTVFSPAIER